MKSDYRETALFLLLTGVFACFLTSNSVSALQHNGEQLLASGNFLVASNSLQDPAFANTVILLLKHDNSGTIGIILNRRSKISAQEVMPRIDWSGNPPNVYFGGPVALNSVRVLVRSEQPLPVGTRVMDEIWIIDSAESLAGYSADLAGKMESNVYIGYAGWLPGQLEAEILRGDWKLWPGDQAAVFTDSPEGLWYEIQQRLMQIWARHGPVIQTQADFGKISRKACRHTGNFALNLPPVVGRQCQKSVIR
ncbi:MAG: YqgE/AlgH family protein [Gammaproteobacteria bacterium]|nr:YqgE/AlgH family protein [Gammaproteobacteria bacterium]